MGLLKCPECSNEVSEYADKCQNCGCPIDVIIKKTNQNCSKIFINGIKGISDDREIDLTDFNKKVSKEILLDEYEVMKFLIENYKVKGIDANLIAEVIKFNNNEIPADYNECLERMRASNRARVNRNTITCPNCHSSNVKPISGTERAVSVLSLGILSKKIGKSYKCLNCKYTW